MVPKQLFCLFHSFNEDYGDRRWEWHAPGPCSRSSWFFSLLIPITIRISAISWWVWLTDGMNQSMKSRVWCRDSLSCEQKWHIYVGFKTKKRANEWRRSVVSSVSWNNGLPVCDWKLIKHNVKMTGFNFWTENRSVWLHWLNPLIGPDWTTGE